MNHNKRSDFWITNLSLTLIVNLLVLITSIQRWGELKIILWRSVWIGPLLVYIAIIGLCSTGIYFLRFHPNRSSTLLDRLTTTFEKPLSSTLARAAAGFLSLAILILIPAAKFHFQVGEVVKHSTIDPKLVSILFYWFVWWFLWLGVGSTKTAFKLGWIASFALFTITAGLSYELYSRALEVNSYPFSLGWSEASRYYYGSLIFSKQIYGVQLPASILHPTRYLLQSVAFLWNDSDLIIHRAWQFFLWVSMLGTAAWSITSKILTNNVTKFVKALITLWVFLFFLKIGVYYHLAPIIFIPILFYSPRKPVKTFIGVILGSIWAGMSRVNWVPVPALITSVLFILDNTADRDNFWRLVRRPTLWVAAGTVAAIASQLLYMRLSGNLGSQEALGSSFTSNLLWNRLLPSDSNPLGVLPWMLIYALPLIYALLAFPRGKSFSQWQLLAAWIIIIVFFLGGLLVSVKIGGGADLHNMDAFAVFLVIIPLLFFSKTTNNLELSGFSWGMLVWALITPLIFTLPNMVELPVFHTNYNQDGVKVIKTLAEQKAEDGEILFINERHLVTFGMIDIPIVGDYEAVTLMEMVMSSNSSYMERFNRDIESQRFAGIVSAKLNTTLKTEGMFFEENNLWNSLVSAKILCYYEPLIVRDQPEPTTTLEVDETKIEFLVPRTTSGDCY